MSQTYEARWRARLRRRAAGRCQRCPNDAEPGHPNCLRCRLRQRVWNRTRMRAWTAQRRARGVCVKCGRDRDAQSVRLDTWHCRACRIRTSRYQVARKARKRQQEAAA